MKNKGLVLIKIEHLEVNGNTEETLWAKPLGQDLYEIRSLPKFIENMNALDIVRAIASDFNDQPLVTETVSKSGHETIRFLFLKSSSFNREDVLRRLRALGAVTEEVGRGFWAVDVDPERDYQKIRDYLSALRVQGVLECELDVGMSGLMRAWAYQD